MVWVWERTCPTQAWKPGGTQGGAKKRVRGILVEEEKYRHYSQRIIIKALFLISERLGDRQIEIFGDKYSAHGIKIAFELTP